MQQNTYTVLFEGTVTTAKTLIQLKAGASRKVELLRAWISQSSVTADDTGEALLLRYTSAGTVTSATPIKHNPDGQAAQAVGGTAATGTNATAEGSTSIENIILEGFSVLAGWVWLPTPEERIIVPPAGFLALKSNFDITSANIIAGMTFREF